MPANAQHTAILLFIRAEHEEARVKSFLPRNYSSNLRITKFLNRKALRLARKTGLPTIVWTGKKQQGHTFGDRFSHAIQSVFQLGYQNVIAIGNDCPQLTETLLVETAEALQHHSLILGPDQHGGVYLIGLHRTAFQQNQFAALPWQDASLFSALIEQAHQEAKSLYLLEAKSDINTTEDLLQVLQILTDHKLKTRLLRLLGRWQTGICAPAYSLIAHLKPPTPKLRGPPLAV